MHRPQNPCQDGIAHATQQPRRQSVVAEAAPAQRLHKHDFQKTLQDHFLTRMIGRTFLHDQVDDAAETSGTAFGRTNVHHAGQQRDQKRRIDHFDPEGTSEHPEVGLTLLFAMPNASVRRIAMDAIGARLAE